MAQIKNIAFGVPSIPRQTFPSMYEILSWDDKNKATSHSHQQIHPQINKQVIQQVTVPVKQTNNQRIVQNISQVKSQYSECKGKKISKSCTKHYQLYEYKQPRHRAQSQSHSNTTKSKIESKLIVKPKPVNLDPNIEAERKQIEQRKKRIKTFELVTRDLPNTAFTTYYGKPAFEAYGRGGSHPNLLTHNVMPHKGNNHPKSVQSYYSALVKGKKLASSNVSHIPRKPIQQKLGIAPNNKRDQEPINIPLSKPDLINNIRFTAKDPRQKKDESIPTNKIAKLKQKIAKSSRKQKKQKPVKQKVQQEDGLKYMNHRQNLLKIIEDKRLNASRLAYKVTDCYPCEWQDQQKYKVETKAWLNERIAGLASKKSDKVGDLLRFNKQSPI